MSDKCEHDNNPVMCVWCAKRELSALRQRVAELEAAQAVVTPNNCRHCHKAAEKMRDAAANAAIMSNYTRANLSAQIRALPLPTCGDCNPLAPD